MPHPHCLLPMQGPRLDDHPKEGSLGVTLNTSESHLKDGGGRHLPEPVSPLPFLPHSYQVLAPGIKPGFASFNLRGLSSCLETSCVRQVSAG